MKNKLIVTGLLLASLAFSGCTPAAIGPNKPVPSQETKSILPSYLALRNKEGVKSSELLSYIGNNFAQASPTEASTMLLGLEDIQKKELALLEQTFSTDEIQRKMQSVFPYTSDLSTIPDNAPADLKSLLIQAKDGGYKIETAEGMYYPVINYTRYKQFQSAVTPDIAAYIDIMSVESEHPPAKDAAIVIGWDEVLRRAAAQERFINQYETSPRVDPIKQLYSQYVAFAFYGANNTPVFSYENKSFNPVAKQHYQTAAANAGSSKLLKAIGDYVAIIAKNGDQLTPEVDQFRKTAVASLTAGSASSN